MFSGYSAIVRSEPVNRSGFALSWNLCSSKPEGVEEEPDSCMSRRGVRACPQCLAAVRDVLVLGSAPGEAGGEDHGGEAAEQR